MPPRAAKRTAAGPGSRRAVRGRAAAGSKMQPLPDESKGKAEEEVELKEESLDEEKPLVVTEENEKEIKHEETEKAEEKTLEENEDASAKREDNAKEPVDEYEKDERLDLEDNDTEYEHEEYGGMDYDEKLEHDPQEEGEEVEEELDEEADVGEEEEGDVVEEEIEGLPEEHEPEDDDEHVEEEHAEMVDAAEEEEHQEVVKERRKRKEFEIFVGGVDRDATEDELRKVFTEVGEVTEVRLMMNPLTKKNKGFAFLRFATAEQAKRACVQLKNPVVHGKQCGVTPSQDSDTLFLGNICRTWTKEALKEKLKHYGVENIDDMTLVEDSNNAGMNRGFAFLEFSSRSDAMDAFKLLQKRGVEFGVDRPAKVSFADSFIDPGDQIMAQVKTVFVDGLPASWSERDVKELLKKYGEIEKVELARNMPSARRKDFGFVTFDTHDSAVTCAKSINNTELGEGGHKAKVRARLSRPLQRSKAKNVGRMDFRAAHGSTRGVRSARGGSFSRSISLRAPRGMGPRLPTVIDRGVRRPSIRDRRPVMAVPPRSRPVAPLPRSYGRRPPVPPYPKSSLTRDYGHRDVVPPRTRAPTDYHMRFSSDRRATYRDDYSPHGSGYLDLPRGSISQSASRRAYGDDSYSQRFERPPLTYREERPREYDSTSGSKRPYASMDDVPPRYAEPGQRHSRARLDYDVSSNASHYSDDYSDRPGRSNVGYDGSRSTLSNQDSHGIYGGRQSVGYRGGSYGVTDVGGMYSSSYGGDYTSRGGGDYMSRGGGGDYASRDGGDYASRGGGDYTSRGGGDYTARGGDYPSRGGGDYTSRGGDVSGRSYSSLYSGRGLGGNSYMGSGSSGSYY